MSASNFGKAHGFCNPTFIAVLVISPLGARCINRTKDDLMAILIQRVCGRPNNTRLLPQKNTSQNQIDQEDDRSQELIQLGIIIPL